MKDEGPVACGKLHKSQLWHRVYRIVGILTARVCITDLHTTERIRAVPRPRREIYGRGNNFLRGADAARYVPSRTSTVKFIKGTSRHGSNGNMIFTRLFFTTRQRDARNLLRDRSACNYIQRLQPRNVVAFSPQHRLRRNFTYARLLNPRIIE